MGQRLTVERVLRILRRLSELFFLSEAPHIVGLWDQEDLDLGL